MGDKAAAPAIGAMVRPLIEGGVLANIAPDDVGYPKDATVEAVRLGLYALVRLGGVRRAGSGAGRALGCAA